MRGQFGMAEGFLIAGESSGDDGRVSLLVEIDFKWLMAGQGWWLDTARFHTDALYAAGLLRWALASPSEPLRECAALLARRLGGLAPSDPMVSPEISVK